MNFIHQVLMLLDLELIILEVLAMHLFWNLMVAILVMDTFQQVQSYNTSINT